MAKADLKNVEPWRVQVGRALARAFALAGVSQKEGAALLKRDQAQVARWVSGVERVQTDAVMAVEVLRRPLILALAELVGEGIEIVTEIRLRRSA